MILERIKLLVNRKKMTIAELERKLDFSQGSISRWNKTVPGSDKIQKVADYFDVTTDYLLGRTDRPNAYLHEDKDITVEEALESVMSYDGKPLSDNDRDVIKGIILGYLNNKQ